MRCFNENIDMRSGEDQTDLGYQSVLSKISHSRSNLGQSLMVPTARGGGIHSNTLSLSKNSQSIHHKSR